MNPGLEQLRSDSRLHNEYEYIMQSIHLTLFRLTTGPVTFSRRTREIVEQRENVVSF